mgnify:CR=1 FL=1
MQVALRLGRAGAVGAGALQGVVRRLVMQQGVCTVERLMSLGVIAGSVPFICLGDRGWCRRMAAACRACWALEYHYTPSTKLPLAMQWQLVAGVDPVLLLSSRVDDSCSWQKKQQRYGVLSGHVSAHRWGNGQASFAFCCFFTVRSACVAAAHMAVSLGPPTQHPFNRHTFWDLCAD